MERSSSEILECSKLYEVRRLRTASANDASNGAGSGSIIVLAPSIGTANAGPGGGVEGSTFFPSEIVMTFGLLE